MSAPHVLDPSPRTIPDFAGIRAPSAPGGSPSILFGARNLVWQNSQTGERSIWLMQGTEWNGKYTSLPSVATPWRIAGSADFDRDGSWDLVWQNTQTGERSIWMMRGSTSWEGAYISLPTVSPAWQIAAVEDFNGDGWSDLVWQNLQTGERSIWLMNAFAWTGAYVLLPRVDPSWSIVAAADMTGDRQTDLVWENTRTGERSIWIMQGTAWDGRYALLPTVSTAWHIAAAADLSADEQADLVWQNTQTGERSVWLMNRTSWDGRYVLLPTVPPSWSIAAVSRALDLTRPTVASVTFSPAHVELVNGSAGTTARVRVLDEGAGVLPGFFSVILRGPTGLPAFCGPATRVSGTAADGVYSCTLLVPPGSSPGSWLLDGVVVEDAAGNVTDLFRPRDAAALSALSAGITVSGPPPDVTPPEIVSVSFSPTTVDVAAGPAITVARLHVTDAGTGVNFGTITVALTDPTGVEVACYGSSSVVGSARDAQVDCPVTIPQGAARGQWKLSFVGVTDLTGNGRYLQASRDADRLNALSSGVVVR